MKAGSLLCYVSCSKHAAQPSNGFYDFTTLILHVAGAMLTNCSQQELLLYLALPFVALAADCRDVRFRQACCCAGGSSAKIGAQLQATCRQLDGDAALCFKEHLAPLITLRAVFCTHSLHLGVERSWRSINSLAMEAPSDDFLVK